MRGTGRWTSSRPSWTCTRRQCCACCARWRQSGSYAVTRRTAIAWARGCSPWPTRRASSTSYGRLLRRICAQLNQRTGQTVHLAAYENGQVIYIDKLDSVQSVRMYSQVGVPAALHCTAVGKVLLAAQPKRQREAVLATHGLPRCHAEHDHRTRTGCATSWTGDQGSVAGRTTGPSTSRSSTASGRRSPSAPGAWSGPSRCRCPDVLLNYDQVLELLPELLATTAAIGADYN